MDLKSGLTYWLDINKQSHKYSKLNEDIECDVVIVGGGISGALSAYNLRNEHLKVVLIDKNKIASQSTAASTALLTYELDNTLSELAEKIGLESAVSAYKLSHVAVKKIKSIAHELSENIDFNPNTSLYLITKKEDYSEMHKEFILRKENGFEVEFLSPEDLMSTFSLKAYGAIRTNESYSVDPIKFTRTLIEEFVKKGNMVFEETEIKSTDHTNGVLLKTADNYSIQTKKVIYAGGYETQKIVKESKIKLISTYVFVSKPLENIQLLKNVQVWEHATPYLYMRYTKDRVVVGGEDEDFFNPDKRDEHIPEKIKILQQKLSELYKGENVIPEYKWAGTFAESEDSLPYFGEVENYPNTFFIIPCGGNGITFSLIGGEMARDWIQGKPTKNLELFKFRR